MKNKKMLLSVFTIGTALTLAACGGDSDTDPTMDEPLPGTDPEIEEPAPDENDGNMDDPNSDLEPENPDGETDPEFGE